MFTGFCFGLFFCLKMESRPWALNLFLVSWYHCLRVLLQGIYMSMVVGGF